MSHVVPWRAWFAALCGVLLVLAGSSRCVTAAEIARFEPLPPPPLSADAVYVVDVSSGTELFAVNPDEPLPPASLTKVVAALVVLDQADPEETVTIETADLVDIEQSQVGLVAGDRLSVRDLFIGMLVPSGNDASLALARHIGEKALGGDTSAAEAVSWFVEAMNQKAAELGATHSHFANPTGIDADGHVMSARDVALLTQAALAAPLFAETVALSSAVLASASRPDGYPVATTNLLLAEGVVTGVKTGTTDKAGGCLVTTFPVGQNDIIAVVLGSELTTAADGLQDNTARFTDTRSIIAAANDEFVWLDPTAPGAVAGLPDELRVWDVALENSALQPVPVSAAADVRYRLVLAPPADPPAAAGAVLFLVDDRLLSERPAIQVG